MMAGVMRLRERIADWAGWRRYGPAAGSAFVHVVAMAALASGLLAASGGERMPQPRPPPPRQLEVTLLAETPTEIMRPPPAAARPRAVDPDGAPPVPKAKDKQQPAAKPGAAAPAPSRTDEGVFLGDASVPPGLGGLLKADPCELGKNSNRRDCPTQWAAKIGTQPSLLPQSEDELRTYHAAFMPVCKWRVGCDPGDGVLLNGARSFGLKSPMASGAGGLQGIHDLVGRLPQPPDFVDPGFGD
jgi:hypothetical protein